MVTSSVALLLASPATVEDASSSSAVPAGVIDDTLGRGAFQDFINPTPSSTDR